MKTYCLQSLQSQTTSLSLQGTTSFREYMRVCRVLRGLAWPSVWICSLSEPYFCYIQNKNDDTLVLVGDKPYSIFRMIIYSEGHCPGCPRSVAQAASAWSISDEPPCISNRDRIPDVPVDGIWYFSGAGTNNSANKYRHM